MLISNMFTVCIIKTLKVKDEATDADIIKGFKFILNTIVGVIQCREKRNVSKWRKTSLIIIVIPHYILHPRIFEIKKISHTFLSSCYFVWWKDSFEWNNILIFFFMSHSLKLKLKLYSGSKNYSTIEVLWMESH